MKVNVWLLQYGIVRLVKPNSVEDRDLARNYQYAVLKGTIELGEVPVNKKKAKEKTYALY